MEQPDNTTRQSILDAALKLFASHGYAGASVKEIVDAAHVTKPALYYYFANKAALYQALVDFSHDERFRLMREAVPRGATLEEKLVELLAALFEFMRGNRDVIRVAFATAFAAPGEMPPEVNFLDKSLRNFEFVHSLIKQAQAAGELNRGFKSQELAYGFFGALNIYVMAELVQPANRLNRQTARRIVRLFLAGAAAKK